MSYIEDLNAITTPSLTDLLYIYQNGDDFKITNQQLLDLIKTNTVIPLFQAEYNALTPAEKNNGSIYVIKDASITADDVEYSSGVSVKDMLDDLSGVKIAKTSLNAVFSNSNVSANIGNAKTLFGLGNDDTIDYIGSFCNGQPLVAFTNSTGGLFCGAVLGQLNATYAFTAICFYH